MRRALVVVVALAIAGCGSSSGSSKSSTTAGRTSLGPTFDDIGTLPGAQKSAPPWDSGAKKLQQRLKAIGLQPLPVEGTVVHIHQHLDVYVDGKHVTVPALIGIGPGGSFFSLAAKVAAEIEPSDAGKHQVEQDQVRLEGASQLEPTFPGGRRFHFSDPSGNELAVWTDR